MYQARRVAWSHRVERKTWEETALEVGFRWDDDEQQRRTVRWTLQRREDYLAARLYHAVPPSYVVQCGEHKGDLIPGALDHIPFRQAVWSGTGLPFRTHPEQCKTIVLALWPRASDADWRETKRILRNPRTKRGRSS